MALEGHLTDGGEGNERHKTKQKIQHRDRHEYNDATPGLHAGLRLFMVAWGLSPQVA